jgi:hypothetical protein
MTLIEHIYFAGIECDRKGCPEKITGTELRYSKGWDHYRNLAASSGWTFWAGTRQAKVFCPNHGPSKGSDMVQVKA